MRGGATGLDSLDSDRGSQLVIAGRSCDLRNFIATGFNTLHNDHAAVRCGDLVRKTCASGGTSIDVSAVGVSSRLHIERELEHSAGQGNALIVDLLQRNGIGEDGFISFYLVGTRLIAALSSPRYSDLVGVAIAINGGLVSYNSGVGDGDGSTIVIQELVIDLVIPVNDDLLISKLGSDISLVTGGCVVAIIVYNDAGDSHIGQELGQGILDGIGNDFLCFRTSAIIIGGLETNGIGDRVANGDIITRGSFTQVFRCRTILVNNGNIWHC